MRRIFSLPFLLCALAACDATGRAGDGAPIAAAGTDAVAATTRIEEGVTVLAHAADAFERAPRFTVDSVPLARLGGTDAATFDLTFAQHVELLSDGRIATLSPVGSRMLIFAADGRGERVIGRAGRGPGEFTAPSDLWRIAGDTLLVPDIANARLNRLHADQPWVEAIPLRTPPDVSPGIQLGGVLPDGRLVVHNVGLGRTGVEDSVVRPPVPVVVLDLASGSAQTIAEVPDLEIVRVETRFRGVTRRMDAALGFGRHAHVVVWDSTIVTGTGDGYALDVRAPDGHVLHRLRLQQTRRQVTAAMRDAYVASRLARFDAGSFERAVDPLESRRLIQYAPFADSLPPYSALHVTPRGTLWVVDAIAPTDSAWTATAFRRDGAIVGRLHMPGAARPVAFDDERVVVRDEDADGVVTMRVHRIVSAAGR